VRPGVVPRQDYTINKGTPAMKHKAQWYGAVCMLAALAVCAVQAQSIETVMNQGMELLRNGAHSQAIAAFRKVMRKDPMNFEAQHNIAFCYLQMGRYNEAVKAFRRAIEINGKSAESWSNLAFAYEQLGNSKKAIDALYASVNLDPSNVTARLNLATMYVNENQHKSAINQFRQIIQMDRENVEAYNNLAKCLMNTGDHKGAAQALREAIAVEPGNAEAHWELGNIYNEREKDPDRAIGEYRTAVNLAPSTPKYYQNLANLLAEKGNKEEAAEMLKKSLVYVDDALAKERIQKKVDRLEGRQPGSTAGGELAPAKTVDMEMQEVVREPSDEGERTGGRLMKTEKMDISSDFEDLNEDEGEELDLMKEAKKRAKK
jgi:Flp pilus assembly protein TadD